jgi:sugar O-acyltransferase (sialic acid O-acetyltransferase NeuD family)
VRKTKIIIVGAGGHGTAVADALLAAGQDVLGFVDKEKGKHGQTICGLPVLGGESILADYRSLGVQLANGVGRIKAGGIRSSVQERLELAGWEFVTVRHPSATVSPFAYIASSVQLMANSVVQPGARVGPGCIVNSAAIVEHDVRLGAFVHVSCNATLCGGVTIGPGSHIGAAAVVRQGVHLGPSTVVGAGAVVLGSFSGGNTLVGVPARILNNGTQ